MLIMTIDQMKRAEKLSDESGISYAQMMENAGTIAYKYLSLRYGSMVKRLVILAGSGNNGGDGFVIVRKLLELGAVPVVILCCGIPKTKLAKENYDVFIKMGGSVIDAAEDIELARRYIDSSPIIVDAIFGTGFHGDVSGVAADMITYANSASGTKVSLDVPSGMNADTGEMGKVCIHAETTLSFAAYKLAHQNPVSKPLCGLVEVLDIGIPADIIFSAINSIQIIDDEMIRKMLPVRSQKSHKGNYGRLLNISGSIKMGGAAMMSTLSAMRAGAGITVLAAPKSVARSVASNLMEAMTIPLDETPEGSAAVSCKTELSKELEKASACLVGCGLSVTSDTKQIVEYVIENTDCTLIFDADALNCISSNVSILEKAHKVSIITPHIGEMARLVDMTADEVSKNAVSVARLFAKEKNVVVVLKGHNTFIGTPEGKVFKNETGNAGLAKGGSGDVLSGMIAAFAAQGMSAQDAAVCGVHIHGLCADRLSQTMSQYSMLARDIIGEIPLVIKNLGR